jgi:hypothetical protein
MRQWTWTPDRRSSIKAPIAIKVKVEFEMNEFIDDVLRKKHIKRPPKDKDRNYIVEIYAKKHQRYFYFCANYHCRAKNCIADFFEMRFARLEYAGDGFNLAYMRHTGQWWEIYQGLTLAKALKTVETEPHFLP